MPKPKFKTVTVEDILTSHNPHVRTLVERLRQIIRDIVPSACEAAHAVWHSINYRHPQGGYFCGIFPQHDSVNLAFEFGALLPDPDGLLDGDGKQVRYVRLKNGKDIRMRALEKLILSAIALPEKRDAKLALIRSGAKPIR
jgi:hypothetical protein